MTNPYSALPDYCFWSRGITWRHPAQIDPMSKAPFLIAPSDKVVTMGSCFAQHISRRLQASGFNYFVPEAAPATISAAKARVSNYGVFSARYGNVYTVKQAVQLFDRAFEHSQFDEIWEKGERWVDPFRPQIEPEGFSSREDLEASRREHLAAVCRVFEEADIMVFTLGLTEAWRSKDNGAVYPTAPGVAGGVFDPDRYEPVNYGVQEVMADLDEFIDKARSVNPKVRIILTVSPVPLKATFEDRHVLQSTIYSKSVLRVAAQHAADTREDVVYFPSFEIISGPGGAGRYYAADLREVQEVGVAHVMRVFERHFIRGAEAQNSAPFIIPSKDSFADIVCDEDVIESALQISKVDLKHGHADTPMVAEFGLSEADVRAGYQMFLGREPESEEAINSHRTHKSRHAFVSVLIRSPEFREKVGAEEAARLLEQMEWSL